MYIYVCIYIYITYNVCIYIYIYSCYTCYTVYIHIIPEMQRSAQAIQVYDRICDFEGVKGSMRAFQQKMKLGMSQIPTEMSMVFIHRSLSSDFWGRWMTNTNTPREMLIVHSCCFLVITTIITVLHLSCDWVLSLVLLLFNNMVSSFGNSSNM